MLPKRRWPLPTPRAAQQLPVQSAGQGVGRWALDRGSGESLQARGVPVAAGLRCESWLAVRRATPAPGGLPGHPTGVGLLSHLSPEFCSGHFPMAVGARFPTPESGTSALPLSSPLPGVPASSQLPGAGCGVSGRGLQRAVPVGPAPRAPAPGALTWGGSARARWVLPSAEMRPHLSHRACPELLRGRAVDPRRRPLVLRFWGPELRHSGPGEAALCLTQRREGRPAHR